MKYKSIYFSYYACVLEYAHNIHTYVSYFQVIRDFVLKDNVLYQTVLMETIKTPLQDHLIVIYKKKI